MKMFISVEEDVPSSDNDIVVVETPAKPSTTRKPITTTQKPITSESIPFDADEPSSCSEQFASYPADCNKYYLCDNGRPLVQSCPPGLHWNNNQRNCDWPHSANCEESTSISDPNKPTTSPRPTTTTTRKPRPPPPTNVIPVENDDGQFKVVCYFSK